MTLLAFCVFTYTVNALKYVHIIRWHIFCKAKLVMLCVFCWN